MSDFLANFLGNPARARVLRAALSGTTDSIPGLAKLAGVTPLVLKKELAVLEKLGVVKKISRRVEGDAVPKGKKKSGVEEFWIPNTESTYLRAVTSFVQETSPSEFKQVEKALKGSGRLSTVILSGIFMGDMTRPADLIIGWDSLDERRLERAVKGLEPFFGREIRYAAFPTTEFRYRLTIQDRLLRDTLDFPHRILVNRAGLV